MGVTSDQPVARRDRAGSAEVLRRAWTSVALSSPLSAREMLGATALLLLIAALVFGPHVEHGSFYLDDWANAAYTAFPPHPGYLGALSYYFSMFGFRPLSAFYVPTLHEVLGLHEHAFIAWAVLLAVAAAGALYAALRALRLERLHAFLLAALVLIFPFSDSALMWSNESTAHLVLALYLLGLTLAIYGLRAPERGTARRYHLASLLLYLIAVSMYEAVATVALASVIIYVWQSDWRTALRRFAVDLVGIAALLTWTATHTQSSAVSSSGGALHHVVLILGKGLYLIAEALFPFVSVNPLFPSSTHLVVLGVTLVLLIACVAAWRLFLRGTPASSDIRRWLLIAIAGPVFAYIAWAIFIPSDPYYEPTTLGIGNRTNVVAAIGLVAGAYAMVMLLGTVLLSRARWRPQLLSIVALAAAIALGVGYVRQVSVDDHQYNQATQVQRLVLSTLKSGIPHPAPGATIYAYGFPNFTGPGVPAFAASWDLNGAVQVLYHDGTLHAYPVYVPTAMLCGARSMYPILAGYSAADSALYGSAYLVNVDSARTSLPRSRAECLSALGRHSAT